MRERQVAVTECLVRELEAIYQLSVVVMSNLKLILLCRLCQKVNRLECAAQCAGYGYASPIVTLSESIPICLLVYSKVIHLWFSSRVILREGIASLRCNSSSLIQLSASTCLARFAMLTLAQLAQTSPIKYGDSLAANFDESVYFHN
jgi:hypothetical protein